MKKSNNNKEPSEENIYLSQSWIVSQYKHEYNPVHTHSGNFSGVIYLKIPDDMENHFNEETKDHYPASGLIEFSHGEKHDFKSDTLMFNPRVSVSIDISPLNDFNTCEGRSFWNN